MSPNLIFDLPSLSGELDLFKSLSTIAGVKTANELSTGLYVRGGSPDQTLTLVDGVIVYNPHILVILQAHLIQTQFKVSN